MLHHASERKRERFIKVNCAALPCNLIESELFGYEKGAFTGADKLKLGKFETASKGVIFLDEIGDMPLALQAKLLEVLQSGKIVRLGGTTEIKVDTWVISSTNRNLMEDVHDSSFREDLYYRLNTIQIMMPPLRERKEDIPLLTKHFVELYRREFNDSHCRLSEELERLFGIYHWPGNVRELANIVMRLTVGEDPAVIASEIITNMKCNGVSPSHDLQGNEAASQENEQAGPLLQFLKAKEEAARYIEKEAIAYALRKTGWKKRAAARMLKISHKALYYKMLGLGIDRA